MPYARKTLSKPKMHYKKKSSARRPNQVTRRRPNSNTAVNKLQNRINAQKQVDLTGYLNMSREQQMLFKLSHQTIDLSLGTLEEYNELLHRD